MNSNSQKYRLWEQKVYFSIPAAQPIFLSVRSLCCKYWGQLCCLETMYNLHVLKIHKYSKEVEWAVEEVWNISIILILVLTCHCCNPESKLTTAAGLYEGRDYKLAAIFKPFGLNSIITSRVHINCFLKQKTQRFQMSDLLSVAGGSWDYVLSENFLDNLHNFPCNLRHNTAWPENHRACAVTLIDHWRRLFVNKGKQTE